MMNHSEALTEQVFSFASELYAYGVREVVISPGSRSTPLALAFEAHPNIKTWITLMSEVLHFCFRSY